MNNDILECKRRAQELVASNSTPLNRNGRKKGYIEVMKQLLEEKGYGHLALKGQNLRDQASRLEKCQEGLADERCVNGAIVITIDESILSSGNSDMVFVEGNRNIESENNSGLEREGANQATSNLHMSTVQLLEELQSDQSKRERSDEVLGSLPECNTLHTPSSFVWGQYNEGRSIIVNVSTIENAYDEISKWHKNTFLVPFGKTGKEFIDTLRELSNKWKNDPPNREKIFANLVMTGQVNSTLRYLSNDQGRGILPLSDDVMGQLKEKHPEPQGVQLGSLLFGPTKDVPDTLYYEINGQGRHSKN
ncbi:unnamed protein product [Pocillopora meandrina]|uniref:Uncharacterized protein n=1 Tax=Pocillopora meandrina TaxID=46732 RepID=A0AAU9WIY9_9CNID|nr:unnamed protein product [Pocillopora meandrina]